MIQQRKHALAGVIFLMMIVMSCSRISGDRFTALSGDYLGQPIPGDEPELFASGIVCTGMSERDVAMMPDRSEIYFGKVVGNNSVVTIMVSKSLNGRWSEPEVATFCSNPRFRSLEPAISANGKKFYFVSDRPNGAAGESEPGNWDIWVMDRTGNEWGEPYNLGDPVNSDAGEFYPSVTRDGTMYFTRGNDIFRSRFVDGAYTDPEKLGPSVNCGRAQYNAFIDPDETYIIVPAFGREDSQGGTDYYIVYRDKSDKWSEPIHLGDKINSAAGQEWSPYVSPDGKIFFFMSNRMAENALDANSPLSYRLIRERYHQPQNGNPDIYWVSASFIDTLRPEGF